MKRERRYAARRGIELPVYIRYRKRPFLGASARNLSVGGMFLSVHSLMLPVGIPIELELRCLGKRWSLPAIVIHGDNRSIGVMFKDPQPALYRELMQQGFTGLPVTGAGDSENAIHA